MAAAAPEPRVSHAPRGRAGVRSNLINLSENPGTAQSDPTFRTGSIERPMNVPPLILFGAIVGFVGEFALHNRLVAGLGGLMVIVGLFMSGRD